MIKLPLGIVLFFFVARLWGQAVTPEKCGFRHLQTLFQHDTVDILVKSKKGEEQRPKPVFLFVQGSSAVPLIITYNSTLNYPVFPFELDKLLESYHVAIISKPSIPVIADVSQMSKELNFLDPLTGEPPSNYINRNYLDYYVKRNLSALDYLQKQSWVLKTGSVVAGHSEGSTIAAKMASKSANISRLIYLSGNPMGRIMSVIEKSRQLETDSNRLAEKDFAIWEKIVKDPSDSIREGDTYKTNYEFSLPPYQYLEKLEIPVLVVYGTKDYCAPFNDYLRVSMVTKKKTNFTFVSYIGKEHNFFSLNKDGSVNYESYGWNKVAIAISAWLNGQTNALKP